MTDRPILMSAPMVRALLDGRKTQTRRVLKPQPVSEVKQVGCTWRFTSGYKTTKANPPYMEAVRQTSYGASEIVITPRNVPCRPGDKLWVKEALRPHAIGLELAEALGFGDAPPHKVDMARHDLCIAYDADGEAAVEAGGFDLAWLWKTRYLSAIFMPKHLSRLTLTVTDVRVERLQDISEEDAEAEGIESTDCFREEHPLSICYAVLWDRINGTGSWEANPWVAAISFSTEHRNIDAPARALAMEGAR